MIESYGDVRSTDTLEFSLELPLCIFDSDGNEFVGSILSIDGVQTADVSFLKIVEQTVAATNFSPCVS